MSDQGEKKQEKTNYQCEKWELTSPEILPTLKDKQRILLTNSWHMNDNVDEMNLTT